MYRSKLLHVASVLFAGFIPLAIFVGPADLFVFIGSVSFTMSITVVHAYWPALKLAVKQSINELDFVDLLTAGITLIFFSTALREAYATFYREFFIVAPQRADDYYLPLAFSRFVAVAAGYMALAAYESNPRTDSKVNRIPGWPRALLALTAGCLLGTGLTILHA
jgi:hypothetical protein